MKKLLLVIGIILLVVGGTAGIGMGFFYYDGEKFEK